MAVVGKRDLILIVDGTDVSDEVSVVTIDSASDDDGFPSFAAARAGGARKYTLTMTMRQNTGASALWYHMWANVGTELDVEFWPCGGGTTPTVDNPQWSGTVLVAEPDGTMLGGEAAASATGVQVAEVAWDFTAKPTLATS